MTVADRIAAALGGRRSGQWWRCRCPAHGSKSASLAIRDIDGRLVLKCHAGCPREAVLGELARLGLVDVRGARANHAEPDHTQREVERRRRVAYARRLWRASYPALGTVVETYLLTRGLAIAVPRTLRYIPAHHEFGRHPSGVHRPQMLGLVTHERLGLVGVSRTYLELDGSAKAALDPPRQFLGPIGGGAVRLALATPALLVAEGIETALSGMVATGWAAWAALSTSGLELLELPALVRTITILVDHDTNGAGERAARTAGARWLSEGRRVRLAIPPEPDTDWNDVLRGGRDASR